MKTEVLCHVSRITWHNNIQIICYSLYARKYTYGKSYLDIYIGTFEYINIPRSEILNTNMLRPFH